MHINKLNSFIYCRGGKTAVGLVAAAVVLSFVVQSTPSRAYVSPSIHRRKIRNYLHVSSRTLKTNAGISIAFNLKATRERRSIMLINSVFDTCEPFPSKTKLFYQGKNILLTGASGGLGQALAFQLAQCRPSKLILSGRDKQKLKFVAQKCTEIASNPSGLNCEVETSVHVLSINLADPASVQTLGDEALKLCYPEAIDVLINNGGISSRSSFLETKVDVDGFLMQVNFLSGAALAKIVSPSMVKAGKGTIIWICGIQGLVGIPNRTSNVASKFAIQGYCQALRAELAYHGIKVHTISPGYIRTNLSQSAILGNGLIYGVKDDTTESGVDPIEVSTKILDGVAKGKSEFIVSAPISARLAIWLRFFVPSLLETLLVERFKSS